MPLSDTQSTFVPAAVFCRRMQTVKSFFSVSQLTQLLLSRFVRQPSNGLFIFCHQVSHFSFNALQSLAQHSLLAYFSHILCMYAVQYVYPWFVACCVVLERVLLSLQITLSPWKLVSRLLLSFTAVYGRLSCSILRSVSVYLYVCVWEMRRENTEMGR